MKILLGLALALTCACSFGVQLATAAPNEEGGRVLESPADVRRLDSRNGLSRAISQVEIRDNTIANTRRRAISVASATDVKIAGNVIRCDDSKAPSHDDAAVKLALGAIPLPFGELNFQTFTPPPDSARSPKAPATISALRAIGVTSFSPAHTGQAT